MKDRIAIHPAIHFSKPCVAGTRIPVENVLELVRAGIPFANIVRDYYPDLTPDDVRACIQHAVAQSTPRIDPLPDDDWFFKTMRDAIAENRQREETEG